MAHLILQLGAALIVPFGVKRDRRQRVHWRETRLHWRKRALREAATLEAGRPWLAGWFGRSAPLGLLPVKHVGRVVWPARGGA